MGFTLTFLVNLIQLLARVWPLMLGLILIIGILSVIVGRREGWSIWDSLYFGFITALTVGYGDMRPSSPLGKLLAVFIALFGLITTGIIVAIAVETAGQTFEEINELA